MINNRISDISVGCFIFTMPWQNMIIIPGIGTFSRVAGAIAFVLMFVSALKSGYIFPQRIPRFLILFFCFILWSICTAFWSNEGFNIATYETLFQSFLMCWMILFCITRRKSTELLFMFSQFYILGAIFTALIGFNHIFFSINLSSYRDIGYFHPNGFAIMLSIGIPLAWMNISYYNYNNSPRKNNIKVLFNILSKIYIPIAILGVLLSGSRTGLICLVSGLSIIYVDSNAKNKKKINLLMVVFLFFSIISYLNYLSGSGSDILQIQMRFNRLLETADEIDNLTFGGRGEVWWAGFKLFFESFTNFMFGIGYGSYQDEMLIKIGTATAPHNVFISFFVETGLIGGLIFCLMLLDIYYKVLNTKIFKIKLFVLFLTLILASLASNMEDNKVTWFIISWIYSSTIVFKTQEIISRSSIGGKVRFCNVLPNSTQS